MAMAVDKNLAVQPGRHILRSLPFQEFAEYEGLFPQAFGPIIRRKQVAEFVSKYGGAAWFQHDDRDAGIDGPRQFPEDLLQIRSCAVDHAEIVERPPAAKVSGRHTHFEARVSQHFVCGFAGLRMKVVVESIRPEDHLPASVAGSSSHGGIGNTPAASPLPERMRGKAGKLPLRSQMQRGTEDLTETRRIVDEVDQVH